MFYMTKSQYDERLEKIRRNNESRELRQKLHRERTKYWPKLGMPSTSKIVLTVAAVLCIEILFFCQYMILKTGDTNALYAMVGTIATLASIVLGYFVKSTKENTAGGITYQTVMASLGQPTIEKSEEAVG